MSIPAITTNPPGTAPAPSTASSAELSQLSNPKLFLQLLIAELQNQDPTNPLDPSQILQQTSELSSVEATTQMTTELATTQATGLIGRTVTAVSNGTTTSGTVSAVHIGADGSPSLTVSGSTDPIALSDITQVA